MRGDHDSHCTEDGNSIKAVDHLSEGAGAIDTMHDHRDIQNTEYGLYPLLYCSDLILSFSLPLCSVASWYYFLCVILWVLEAMRMASPRYMPSLHDFWRLDHPKPNEQIGKRTAERQETLLSQWETIISGQKQVIMNC